MRLIMSEKRGRNKLTLEGCRLVSEVRQTQRERERERERERKFGRRGIHTDEERETQMVQRGARAE